MKENDNTIIRITNQGLKFELSCASDRLVAQTQLLNLCVSNCFNQLDLLFSTRVSGCACITNLHELCMHVSNCSRQISIPVYVVCPTFNLLAYNVPSLCHRQKFWDGQSRGIHLRSKNYKIIISYAFDSVEISYQFHVKLALIKHELHETGHSVTFIVLVNSHQRWKQTRNRVCFHVWRELTSTMNVTEWPVSWNSWEKLFILQI